MIHRKFVHATIVLFETMFRNLCRAFIVLMRSGGFVPFAELAGVRPGEERELLGPARKAKLELRVAGDRRRGREVGRGWAAALQTAPPPAEGLWGTPSDSPFLSWARCKRPCTAGTSPAQPWQAPAWCASPPPRWAPGTPPGNRTPPARARTISIDSRRVTAASGWRGETGCGATGQRRSKKNSNNMKQPSCTVSMRQHNANGHDTNACSPVTGVKLLVRFHHVLNHHKQWHLHTAGLTLFFFFRCEGWGVRGVSSLWTYRSLSTTAGSHLTSRKKQQDIQTHRRSVGGGWYPFPHANNRVQLTSSLMRPRAELRESPGGTSADHLSS